MDFSKILKSKYFNSFIWIIILCFLRLPVKEYFQIFLGVPLRLITADILEKVFHFLNIDVITQSSILMFENNAMNIDYPCSGISTVYYMLIFIIIIGIIKHIPFNFKLIINLFLCTILAVLLNIFRVYIIVLLSLDINYIVFADKIHILLGIVNYVLICLTFLFVNEKNKSENNTKPLNNILVLVFFIILYSCFLYYRNHFPSHTVFKVIQNLKYENLELSDAEKSLFLRHGAEVEKYNDGENIVIRIKSDNYRAMHNPEICLKNQGFKIYSSTAEIIDSKIVRKLKTNKGFIYYWFTNGNITTDDYYKRVFDSFFTENKVWTLIIVYSLKERKTLDF